MTTQPSQPIVTAFAAPAADGGEILPEASMPAGRTDTDRGRGEHWLERMGRASASGWLGMAVAVLGVAGAAASRWVLGGLVGETLPPYITFYPVVIVSALLGGTLFGLLATVLSAAAVTALFIWPPDLPRVTGLVLFTAINVALGFLCGALRTAWFRARATGRELSETMRMLDMACVLALDLNGRITRWSVGCKWRYGFSPPEALNRRYFELLRARSAEKWENIRAEVLLKGCWTGDLTHTTADGREVVSHCEWALWRNDAGQPAAILVAASDITARKAAEEALGKVKAEWERTFDSVPDMIAIIDERHRIVRANRAMAERLKVSPGDCVGLTCHQCVHGLEEPPAGCPHAQTILDGQEHTREVHDERLGGDFLVTTTPMFDGEGRMTGSVHVARDITERKRAEEALRRAHQQLAETNQALENIVQDRTAELRKSVQELEHFSYSITHDMRAPLRAMRSYASLLLQTSRGHLTDDEKDWLQNIATSAERMDRLILDALDYAKAMREALPLAPVAVDALVHDMLRSYPAFHPAVAHITVEGVLPPVVGNAAGLTQCFSNLLNNAVKFVPPGQMPQVRVGAERRDGRVRLWVEDKGIGIAREHHERIFQMFQRVGEDYEGTGIGLALVHKLAGQMNGRVGVESEPGQGSRFWLELDAAETQGKETA